MQIRRASIAENARKTLHIFSKISEILMTVKENLASKFFW